MVEFGLVWMSLVWCGLVQCGMDKFGLVWFIFVFSLEDDLNVNAIVDTLYFCTL